MLTLSNFEKEIDKTVVSKGCEYYNDGNVWDLAQTDGSIWTATVYGTEEYEVIIHLKDQNIIDCNCSCPYDFGPYCKHEVAVCYAIRDATQKRETTKPHTALPTNAKKIATQSLEEILSGLDKRVLIQILSQQAAHDPKLKAILLADYATKVDPTTKNAYKKLITQALREGEDRNGFIDYWSTMKAMRGVYTLLYKADDLVLQNEASRAVPIFQAAIEILVPTLQRADDSNGEIGGEIDHSFILLKKAASQLSKKEQEKLFQYLLQESQDRKYEGWHFKWQFLEIAGVLVDTQQKQKELFHVLDVSAEQQKDEITSEFDQETAAEIKLSVLQRLGQQKDIEMFLKKHLHLHNIRKTVIEQALQQNNLETAKKLCIEAINIVGSKYPGLVIEYKKTLLDIAKKQSDLESTLQLAEQLFLMNADFTYYDLLRKIISKGEWQNYLKTLIDKIEKDKGWRTDYYTLATIYSREGMTEKLIRLIEKHNDIYLLKQYEEQLQKDYKEKIADIYKNEAYGMLNSTTDRATYEEACQYLIRLKKLGKIEEVKAIKQDLQDRYKKRRALLEELAKV